MATNYYVDFIHFKKENPISIQINEIIKKEKYGNELGEILITLKVDDLFTDDEIPKNLNNFYTWAAIQIKKFLKREKQMLGLVRCTYYINYDTNPKYQSSIVMNLDTERELDATLFE